MITLHFINKCIDVAVYCPHFYCLKELPEQRLNVIIDTVSGIRACA